MLLDVVSPLNTPPVLTSLLMPFSKAVRFANTKPETTPLLMVPPDELKIIFAAPTALELPFVDDWTPPPLNWPASMVQLSPAAGLVRRSADQPGNRGAAQGWHTPP